MPAKKIDLMSQNLSTVTKPVKPEIDTSGWDDYYRRYQRRLADGYLIPVLRQWGIDLTGASLLEVGCGDGGCGAAFEAAGARVTMMDLDARLVDSAENMNRKEGLAARTFVGDVFDGGADFYAEGPFDIVVLRDVIEHLEDPVLALRTIGQHLSAHGVIFIVFPPYYSPYGGHQQILPRRTFLGIPYNKLPYLQALPQWLFRRIVAGDTPANAEVQRLRGVRLTLRKFKRSVTAAGFTIREQRFYLSRPTFTLRYGLPVLGAGIVGRVPLLNEIAVTAGYFVLERGE